MRFMICKSVRTLKIDLNPEVIEIIHIVAAAGFGTALQKDIRESLGLPFLVIVKLVQSHRCIL